MTLAGLRHLEEFLLRNGVERDHHELPVADVYLMRCVGLDHNPGLISSDRSVQDFVTECEGEWAAQRPCLGFAYPTSPTNHKLGLVRRCYAGSRLGALTVDTAYRESKRSRAAA